MAFEWPFDIGNGSLAADRSHVSLIEIVKGLIPPATIAPQVRSDQPPNALGSVAAHLYRRLCDSGTLSAVLLNVSKIAADKNLRMPRRIQMPIDKNTAPPVGFNAQQFAQR